LRVADVCIGAKFVSEETILLTWCGNGFEIVRASDGEPVRRVGTRAPRFASSRQFVLSHDAHYVAVIQSVNQIWHDGYPLALWSVNEIKNGPAHRPRASRVQPFKWLTYENLPGYVRRDEAYDCDVTCVAFSPAGWAVAGTNDGVLAMSVERATRPWFVDLLTFSDRSNLVSLRNGGDGDLSEEDEGVSAVCVSSDGRFVAAAVYLPTIDVTNIKLYDVRRNVIAHTFTGIGCPVRSMEFFAYDQGILCCVGTSRFYDPNDDEPHNGVYKLWRPQASLLAALGGAGIGHFFTIVDGDHAIGWRVGAFTLEPSEPVETHSDDEDDDVL